MKQDAIIVDLDGTLCNTEHRQHLVEAKKWDQFYDALDEDIPHPWCMELVRAMAYRCTIIFVSGRPDSHRERTIQWMKPHLGSPRHLFMRKTGDYRKDSIVKEEIYREHIEPNFNILFCVDDRKQVVDMWRSIGLVCLQCAEGDF